MTQVSIISNSSKSALSIAGAKIRMDAEGRYSLNDLHKAAGGEKRHGPNYWLENQQTKDIAQELSDTGIPVSVTVKGGAKQGTYVCKELVYAYAMWLSPKFHVKVIRAYDDLVNDKLLDQQRTTSRQVARLEAPYLTDAIKHSREVHGKPCAHYHFSNEFDLINRVALGQSAKAFRISHDIAPSESIRDHLTGLEIKCVEHLQRSNAAMIDIGFDFEKRKTELHKLYVLRHSVALLSEVKRLQA